MGNFSLPSYNPPPVYSPGPYNTGQTGGSAVSGGYNPFAQRDVYNLFQNLGENYYQQGQDFTNSQANLANYYNQSAGQYGDLTNQLYNPIWNGGGGYSQDQMNNVLQAQGLNDVNNDLPNNFLTADEQSGVTGNPYQSYDTFNKWVPSINNLSSQFATGQQEAAAGGETRGNTALASMRNDYTKAINPNDLSLSPDYLPGVNNALRTGANQLNSAENNPDLNLTDEYLRQAGMTDQEVNDLAESAATGVGAQYQSTEDKLAQQARQSGNASPLALASAYTRLDRDSAASQADAANAARMNARGAQRTAAQNVQNTRLNAGQYKSGLTSANSLAQEGADIGAHSTAEQMRLAAASGLAGLNLNAATNLGNAGLSEADKTTANAMSALDKGYAAGDSALKYAATTGAGLQQTAEGNASNRATALAGNRQTTNQGNQATRLATNNALANRYQQGYQPWVTQQNMGLQVPLQEQQFYGNQGNTATAQRLQGQGQAMQGTLGAAQGYAGWGNEQNQVGFGSNFSKAFGGALGKTLGSFGVGSNGNGGVSGGFGGYEEGGLIDHNQLIEVGEHDRPEVILPLDPRTPPEHRNQFEEMGARLGREMGITSEPYSHDQTLLDEDDGMRHFSRGGFTMPSVSMPHGFKMPRTGLHLNMPLRMPRISQPIWPMGLPGEGTGYAIHPKKYERGGVINTQYAQKPNTYRSDMGRHNRPLPMPYHEMGSLTGV